MNKLGKTLLLFLSVSLFFGCAAVRTPGSTAEQTLPVPAAEGQAQDAVPASVSAPEKYAVYFSPIDGDFHRTVTGPSLPMNGKAKSVTPPASLTVTVLGAEYSGTYAETATGGSIPCSYSYRTEAGDTFETDPFGYTACLLTAAYHHPAPAAAAISQEEAVQKAKAFAERIFGSEAMQKLEQSSVRGGEKTSFSVWFRRVPGQDGIRMPGKLAVLLSPDGNFIGYYAFRLEAGLHKKLPEDFSIEQMHRLIADAVGTETFRISEYAAELLYTGQLALLVSLNIPHEDGSAEPVSLTIPLEEPEG